ncbi:hypothetical protein HNQ60_004109 [Povalibacter uvarum]|uniref:Uncharacterized protein n=1 Tax=Povalibacter uvarum TaxID=732238 RepID=A0A841HSE1_9GAMM|nr:hypothetical protein [Povalibacter uvarum]MBB6095219.1 hypothetical protein [Povalibacter uvarum]
MKLFLGALVPAILLAAAPLSAQEAPSLKGKYAVVIQEDCVFSASGFGPGPLFQALGPVTRGTGTLQGEAILSSDGTGQMTLNNAFIGTNPALTPALGYALTCPVQHSVGPAGDFEATFDCTGVTTTGTGSQVALQVFQNGMAVNGHARAKRFVLAASTGLDIETIGSAAATPVQRMCHRTFQLLKLAKNGGE